MGFREDFAWGTATSSYQIEGAVKGEGKGEHIWDVYTKEPGHVFEGHTGETACDHYHRYPEDVNDVISLDGKVHDPNRIDFLARYLHELKRADSEIDLRGYFQWSLMDNFEWSEGYAQRFGLVYVDFRNQQRILKDSAYWYRDVIRENGNNL